MHSIQLNPLVLERKFHTKQNIYKKNKLVIMSGTLLADLV